GGPARRDGLPPVGVVERVGVRPGRRVPRGDEQGGRARRRHRPGGVRGVRAMSERVLVIDNYDSFTYNLVDYIATAGAEVRVERNDAVTAEEAETWAPTHVVVSPGPGTPREAGVSEEIVRRMAGRVPILGVCLGHQVICELYGGRVDRAGRIVHGKPDDVTHDGSQLFAGRPAPS